ncbi:GYDIA family GHMP kinase [Aureicoccus marinus]|uniref:GHMP kinase n=1 Tax=Aureicoccus marinus TaxID=754435 RepID=A0A2S7TAB5_9FLAO|nr:GYDIA family GHMP kinase [Aureicoccus marinus]PQJ16584.1 hypothetical protein BST99_13425 [Aureicoccus marinus]
MQEKRYYGRGKLLITGEYAVLDGALALAIPTIQGQSLHLQSGTSDHIVWKSQVKGEASPWFEAQFDLEGHLLESNDIVVGERLEQLLGAARELNPVFLEEKQPLQIEALLEFPRQWGLGSSSTLLHLLAQWAGVDPYELMYKSFGKSGSGYDLACAGAEKALLYGLENGPKQEDVDLPWTFSQQLLWVYREVKQDSRSAIEQYRKRTANFSKQELEDFLEQISALSLACSQATELSSFEQLLSKHEELLGAILGMPPVQDSHFSDYTQGVIKSLGAWGGDFILATAQDPAKASLYFKEKGYNTLLTTEQLLYPSL